MSADEAHPASFRDPSGHLFRRDGVLYRHVAPAGAADYDLQIGRASCRERVWYYV